MFLIRLEKIAKVIDGFTEVIGRAVSWLALLLVLLICLNVSARYFFNITYIYLFELEWHLFAMIFLLGAGYTLKHDRHVRVDIFYTQISERAKHWINLLGTLLFLFPFCILVLKASIPYVEASFKLKEASSDPGGLPARYFIKSMIIVGFALLMLQGVSLMLWSLSGILNRKGSAAS